MSQSVKFLLILSLFNGDNNDKKQWNLEDFRCNPFFGSTCTLQKLHEQMLPRQIPWRFALAEGKPFCHSDGAESRRQFGMKYMQSGFPTCSWIDMKSYDIQYFDLDFERIIQGSHGHSLPILAKVCKVEG